jgi:glycosyltransferase involved in cell wall biosynthesis
MLLVQDSRKWDAIHANQPHLQSLAALFAARIRGSRFVVTYHLGLPAARHTVAMMLQTFTDRMLRSLCRAVVYVSRATAQEFGSERGRIIYIGIDIALASAALDGSPTRGRGPFTFIYIGRQTRVKGFFDLLEAVHDLSLRRPRGEFRLILVGDAPREEEAQRARRIAGLRSVVEDHGSIKESLDRLRILATADAVVLPSYREGLPLVLLEAMSVGCVPITAPVGGIPEIVKSGRTGILVPPGNLVALEETLLWALMNRGALAEMGHEGRNTVVRRFNLDRTIEEYLELYAGR